MCTCFALPLKRRCKSTMALRIRGAECPHSGRIEGRLGEEKAPVGGAGAVGNVASNVIGILLLIFYTPICYRDNTLF